MLADQRCAANSKDNPSDLFPTKRKTGVLKKTRQALEKVNSKLKNSSKPMSKGQMMLFESDNSLNFNMEDEDDNVAKPFSEMTMTMHEKGEEDSATRATEVESYSDHKEKDTKEFHAHQEEDAKLRVDIRTDSMPSPRQHDSLVSPRKKLSSRTISRSSRGRKLGNPPQKASSCGDIHLNSSRSSKRPSSARLKRHMSAATQSPGNHTTPTRLSKESINLQGLPETPLTPPIESLHGTPKASENSMRKAFRASEDDTGPIGGYFGKMVEKMEGDGAQDHINDQKAIEDIEEGKKASKFKTPKGIKKLFSMNRDKTPRQLSVGNPKAAEEATQENDLAMFTAFISSPKPLDSPRRSERKQRSNPVEATDDDCEPEMDFPEIPAEKQTRLEDIRKEVCWKREAPIIDSFAGQESPRARARKSKGEAPKEPSSPGSLRHRRSKTHDTEDHAKRVSEESIPRHSISTRRNRALRTSESSSHDKEKQEDKLLSRSAHRSRRSRGSTSRASDHICTRKSLNSTERTVEEREIQDGMSTSNEKKDQRPLDFRLSRSSRGSSRRLVLNPASENMRRKRISGSRRPDRPATEHDSANGREDKMDSGGHQRQYERSTSVSQLYNKTEMLQQGRKFQSLCVDKEHDMNNLFCVNEIDFSDAEEESCDDGSENGVDTAGFPSVQGTETPKTDYSRKAPSLAESLEKGSDLNHCLFDYDGQETVVTDDGSCWLDQGSVSGLNIRSSASVVAPQLSFDQNMTKIVEHA